MDIGERIKQIRKNQKLTMEAFGQRIGVTRNSISMIESGRNNPSEQTIRSICREFSVSETWLRTGEGDMYEPQPTDLLDALTVEYGFTEKERRVAEMFLTLDVARRREALEYLSDVVDALNGDDNTQKADVVPMFNTYDVTGTENTRRKSWDEMTKEEKIAEFTRQLDEEEETNGEEYQSGGGASA